MSTVTNAVDFIAFSGTLVRAARVAPAMQLLQHRSVAADTIDDASTGEHASAAFEHPA